MNPSQGEVTRLLSEWSAGDAGALNRLLPLVFDELRRMARRQLLQSKGGNTLQPTALVNEVYLRLVGKQVEGFEGRSQFFALAARMMRGILVDRARARRTEKRGGGTPSLQLDDIAAVKDLQTVDLDAVLMVHEALKRLQAVDAGQARLVELRYFGGLTLPESAEVLGVSLSTAERRWSVARRWLAREISPER